MNGFQKMLKEYQILLGGFSIRDFFPSMEFIHTLVGMKSRLQNTFQCFDQLFDQLLAEHEKSKKETEEQDFVDVLLDIQKNGSDDQLCLTMDNIKAAILVNEDFYLIYFMTFSIQINYTILELVTHIRTIVIGQVDESGVNKQSNVHGVGIHLYN